MELGMRLELLGWERNGAGMQMAMDSDPDGLGMGLSEVGWVADGVVCFVAWGWGWGWSRGGDEAQTEIN